MKDLKITLTEREKKLIIDQTYAEENLKKRLENAKVNGKYLNVFFSFEELDELTGAIAAEFNHTDDDKTGKDLDKLYKKLVMILDSEY